MPAVDPREQRALGLAQRGVDAFHLDRFLPFDPALRLHGSGGAEQQQRRYPAQCALRALPEAATIWTGAGGDKARGTRSLE